jgi:hypothetical protein
MRPEHDRMSAIVDELGHVLVALLRGVLYADQQPRQWEALQRLQGRARDHLAVLGLNLHIDEGDGFAFLRQVERADEDGADALPRLVARRPLTFGQSVLCLLLRKRLLERDLHGGDPRVVVRRDDLVEELRPFMPAGINDAKRVDQAERYVAKLVDYGYLREIKGEPGAYEIRRVLKALLDADWLERLEHKLAEYAATHGIDPD